MTSVAAVFARVLAVLVIWLPRLLWMFLVQLFIAVSLVLLWLSLSATAPVWLWQQFGERVPGLQIEGMQGRLVSGLHLQRVHWQSDALAVSLTDVTLGWQVSDLLKGRAQLHTLAVAQAQIRQLRPSAPGPVTLPAFSLPMWWSLPSARIGEFRWQPAAGKPLTLHDLQLSGHGSGDTITLTRLQLRHELASASVSGSLQTAADWPLQASLVLTPATPDWPAQRLSLRGGLSALELRARGPARYPVSLQLVSNLLLEQPSFQGRLTWPRWQPPGQQDWLLAPGSLVLRGTATAGEARLQAAATPLRPEALGWPAAWPRQVTLAGPLTWRRSGEGMQVEAAQEGRFGNLPTRFRLAWDSQRLHATRLDLTLADARLQADGWPGARGLRWQLGVPALQRFQASWSGALESTGQWQGAWPDGRGQLVLQLRQLRQGRDLLLRSADIGVTGSLAQHQIRSAVVRDEARASLVAAGGLDVARKRWQGVVRDGVLTLAQGSWRQQEAAAVILTPERQQMARHCWAQSPWRLCADADLQASGWLARVDLTSSFAGRLTALLRRDPRQKTPVLDGELSLSGLLLQELPLPLPAGLAVAGRVDGQARLGGSLAAPRLQGGLRLRDGRVSYPEFGLDWQPLTLDMQLLGDRARWQGRWQDAQGGQATLDGDATLSPWRVQARLNGQQLAMRYQPWVRSAQVSPELTLDVAAQGARLRGSVLVPRADAVFTLPQAGGLKPSPDVRIVRDRQGRVPVLAGTRGQGGGLPLDMAVVLRLGQDVQLSGQGLTARLLGQLQLQQSPGKALIANGELRLNDNARFEGYGQKLTLRQSRFLFAGPLTRPELQVEAVREVDGRLVGVRLSGRPPTPRAELFSDEAMAQEDILALLVLGRTLDEGTGAPSEAERQAFALGAALKLGGRTGLMDKLGTGLGIRNFAVSTQGESEQTQVAVSGFIGEDLFLSVGMGVFEPTQTVKLRYQVNRRLALEAMSSLQSAITLFYTWRF